MATFTKTEAEAIIKRLGGRVDLTAIETNMLEEARRILSSSERIITYLAIVLDESGSMGSMRKQAIDSFNEQVQAIKTNTEGNMESYVSLVKFSDNAREVFRHEDALHCREIGESDYIPSGLTAEYDGIGLAIEILKASAKPSDANIAYAVCVISDGYENASKKYTQSQISSQIKDLEAQGNWTFTFMGANVDLHQISKDLGIKVGNMINYAATPDGYAAAGGQTVCASMNFMKARSVGETQTFDFYDGKDDDDNEKDE